MKEKYFVISKHRSFIEIEDILYHFKNPRFSELDTFKEFSTLKAANSFLRRSFFDDSDYAVFKFANNKWERL